MNSLSEATNIYFSWNRTISTFPAPASPIQIEILANKMEAFVTRDSERERAERRRKRKRERYQNMVPNLLRYHHRDKWIYIYMCYLKYIVSNINWMKSGGAHVERVVCTHQSEEHRTSCRSAAAWPSRCCPRLCSDGSVVVGLLPILFCNEAKRMP